MNERPVGQLVNKRTIIKRKGVILKGASEVTTDIQTDDGRVELTTKDGDLALLCVTNFHVGSSFEHLDDDALAALQHQIEAHFARKHMQARQRALQTATETV